MDSRKRMVEVIKNVYSLDCPEVFSVMLKIPREDFVPFEYKSSAYSDMAIPIGEGQTISQPYTVALMTHLLALTGQGKKVLEIGTGSGYQAAILSHLASEVYSIERLPVLAAAAKKRLARLGYKNIHLRQGRGELGWKAKAPFDAIIITAGVKEIPPVLFEQLKDRGVLVAPVGSGEDKTMVKFTKKGKRFIERKIGVFNFVPLVRGN